jgi:hypothetical protein
VVVEFDLIVTALEFTGGLPVVTFAAVVRNVFRLLMLFALLMSKKLDWKAVIALRWVCKASCLHWVLCLVFFRLSYLRLSARIIASTIAPVSTPDSPVNLCRVEKIAI